MPVSKTIAGLIGPTLVAIAAAVLLNLDFFPVMAQQVSREPALIFLSGILLFVAGLAIVRVHNVWTGGWPVLVTVLGWLAMIGGLVRLFFPGFVASLAARIGPSIAPIVATAAVCFLVGAFLSYKAYGRD